MIRFLISCLICTTIVSNTTAQDVASYHDDLKRLGIVIRKLPSYKAQIKGRQLQEFNQVYKTLYDDTTGINSDTEVFQKFARLFFLLKDNHLAFYQLPKVALTIPQLKDSLAIKQYRSSESFLHFPRVLINIDSLEQALQASPPDSIEGIYYYENYLRLGLYQSGPGTYTGVILSTTLPQWDTGQIAIQLYKNGSGGFRAIYAHPVYKNHFLYGIEKFRNRSLVNSYFYSSVSESVYRKNPGDKDYVNIHPTAAAFSFISLNIQVQYLRLGNFSNHRDAVKVSQTFIERIKDSLTAPNLIVDMRNNTGGAGAVSDRFLKLITQYLKTGKVYILQNNGTMSRGEIFILQLKKKDKVRTFGQTTRGILAYGSNSGKIEKLPSGKMQVYITDMKDPNNRVAYENIGVTPDVWFKDDGDWIEKVSALINTTGNP
jgi:hypothetical protein